MATDVYYNSIVLHNVMTREFSQSTVMDSSGTDQIGQKFTLQVEGILHLQSAVGSVGGNSPTPSVGPAGYSMGGGSIADLYAVVRAKLSQPRGLLEVWVGPAGKQQRLFRCVPTMADTSNDPDRDVGNGPKPKSFNLTQIAGHQLFRVSFTVECEKCECARMTGGNLPDGLNNRWTVSEMMDSDFYTTRTISGHLRLSKSAYAALADSPMSFKPLVIPPLEDGFRREQISFSVGLDGLTADYQITDRQVYTAPPWPITNWSCRHTESTAEGVNFISDVTLRLSAPPSVPTALVVGRALEIGMKRLEIKKESFTDAKRATMILEHASVTVILGDEHAVEARFRVRHGPTRSGTTLGNLVTDRLVSTTTDYENLGRECGQPADYNPRVSSSPLPYGYEPHGGARDTTTLFLLTCCLQVPCGSDGKVPGQFQSSGKTQTGNEQQYTTTVTETKSPSSKETAPNQNYSEETQRFTYTVGKMESKYIIIPLTVQMPKAVSTNPDEQDEDADTCVFVELGPPQCQREILYEAERIGEPPAMPEPLKKYEDGKLKGRLLSATMSFCPPSLSADGQSTIYRTTARYLYGLNRAPRKEETLRTGVLPFTNFTLEGTNATDTVGTSVALEYAFDSKIGP